MAAGRPGGRAESGAGGRVSESSVGGLRAGADGGRAAGRPGGPAGQAPGVRGRRAGPSHRVSAGIRCRRAEGWPGAPMAGGRLGGRAGSGAGGRVTPGERTWNPVSAGRGPRAPSHGPMAAWGRG